MIDFYLIQDKEIQCSETQFKQTLLKMAEKRKTMISLFAKTVGTKSNTCTDLVPTFGK